MEIVAAYALHGLLASILILVALLFWGAPLWLFTLFTALALFLGGAPQGLWIAFAAVAILFNVFPIRTLLISRPIMMTMKKLGILPHISETEMTALRAGGVWVEGELFSGKPDFEKLLNQPYAKLSPEEEAFLAGPVEEVCRMCNDWEVHQKRDLSPEVWEHLKKHKYFGMIIPKEYGGLGFSATAHSEVIMKLASRSVPLSITAMVPNSLGPAELLNHYGTDEQRRYYLPRLATGEEIPCFALTEPTAGSDAASIQANGVVFKGTDGKLYLRLNWNKRYITLAAISTILGLAFKLKDPDGLLGKGTDLGITCALIPTKAPGVMATRRHDPLGVPFYNCPTQGKDVVVPIDAIIGGVDGIGRGWKMLMECLAAGRGISLPAQATAGTKYTARISSAHAGVRKQFGTSVGKFEGIAEPLARVTGFAYMLEAARLYTLGGIDAGIKPPVVTAICKYYFTELQRKAVSDGMDILGGQGISQGPRNLLANGYKAIPISITVEGANILTRTLIIFGQGALRAHPYAYKEVNAVETGDVNAFDRAFWGHVGHVIRNLTRTVLLSVTRGYLSIPARGGATAKYYRRLSWISACFAFMADLSMATLGGKLKVKGKTTGRFADVLGWMYIAVATLKRFEMEGRRKEDLPLLHWTMNYALTQIQLAFDGIFGSVEAPILGWLYRGPIRWYHAVNPMGTVPVDELDVALSEIIQTPGEQRDRLTKGLYMPKDENDQLAKLEKCFVLSHQSDSVNAKVRRAVRKKQLAKQPSAELFKSALAQGIITQPEYDSISQAEAVRTQVIQVDDFGLDEYKQLAH